MWSWGGGEPSFYLVCHLDPPHMKYVRLVVGDKEVFKDKKRAKGCLSVLL